jgi:aminopeptidase N
MLAQMVRDGKLAPLRFIELALAGIGKENDDGMLSILLGRHSRIDSVYEEYLTQAERAERAPLLERIILERLAASEKGSSPQMLFFDFFVRTAQTKEGLERISAWLEGKSVPEGITLDQERRWAAILALARHGFATAPELIRLEASKDPSDLGKRAAYSARVALPLPAAKQDFWRALEHPETLPPSTLRSAASEFHQANFPELSRGYVKSYFGRLRSMEWKKSDHLVGIYFQQLFPGLLCEKTLLEESEAELRKAKRLTALARRSWLERNDELRRCVKVRK